MSMLGLGYVVQMAVFNATFLAAMEKLKSKPIDIGNATVDDIRKQWQIKYDMVASDFALGKDISAELPALVLLTKKLFTAKMQQTPDWESRLAKDPEFAGTYLLEIRKMHELRAKFIFNKWNDLYNKAVMARSKGEDIRQMMIKISNLAAELEKYGTEIKSMFGDSGQLISTIWPKINPDGISNFLDEISNVLNKTSILQKSLNSNSDIVIVGIATHGARSIVLFAELTRKSLPSMSKDDAASTANAQARLFNSGSNLEQMARKMVVPENSQAFETAFSMLRAEAAEFVKEVKRLNITIEPGLLEAVIKYSQANTDAGNKIGQDRILLANMQIITHQEESSPHERGLRFIWAGDFRNAFTILCEEIEQESKKIEEEKKSELEKYYLKLEQTRKDLDVYYAKVEAGQQPDRKEAAEVAIAMLALAKQIDTFTQKEIQLQDAMNAMGRKI